MIKTKFLAAMAALCFLLGPAMADDSKSGKLVLSATGSVKVAPNIASVRVGVKTDAPEARQALDQNSKKMKAVYDALEKIGIAKKDLQTSSLNLQTRYDYKNNQNGAPRLIGYQVSNMVNVTVRNLEKLGSVLDTVVKAGSNTLQNIAFDLDNPEDAKNSARQKAVAKLKAKADLYAKAAGVRLGRIVEISESQQRGFPVPVMARRAFAASLNAAPPPPIAQGELDIQVSVMMVFEILD